MKDKIETALNALTEITDEDIINSKHYEDAIMALCELNGKVDAIILVEGLKTHLTDKDEIDKVIEVLSK